MRPGGSTPDRALRTTTAARRASGTTGKVGSLQRRVGAAGGTWPPNSWSDDGATPANIDAGTGNLVNLGELEVGPNGTGETTTFTGNAIDVAQGGTGTFFQVDANSGSIGGHKVAKVQVFMLHADDFLEVRNTSNAVRFKILGNGAILMSGLPTSDPGVSGQLWKNSGVVTVSP